MNNTLIGGFESPNDNNYGNDDNTLEEQVTATVVETLPVVETSALDKVGECDASGYTADVAKEVEELKEQTEIVKKRKRGTAGGRDHIWPRHHALCMMAVFGDLHFGGYMLARQAPPGQQLDKTLNKVIPTRLLELCPWILKPGYLNLEGTRNFNQVGPEKSFFTWAYNRLYYFYHYAEHSEHPASRIMLREVYRHFYDTFLIEAVEHGPVSEDRAKEFWISVADRVPFQAPAPIPPVDNETEQSFTPVSSEDVNSIADPVVDAVSAPVFAEEPQGY